MFFTPRWLLVCQICSTERMASRRVGCYNDIRQDSELVVTQFLYFFFIQSPRAINSKSSLANRQILQQPMSSSPTCVPAATCQQHQQSIKACTPPETQAAPLPTSSSPCTAAQQIWQLQQRQAQQQQQQQQVLLTLLVLLRP